MIFIKLHDLQIIAHEYSLFSSFEVAARSLIIKINLFFYIFISVLQNHLPK